MKSFPPLWTVLCTTRLESSSTIEKTHIEVSISRCFKKTRSKPWMRLTGPNTWLRWSTACGSMSSRSLLRCICRIQASLFSSLGSCFSMWQRNFTKCKNWRSFIGECLKHVAVANNRSKLGSSTQRWSLLGTLTQTRLHLEHIISLCCCVKETQPIPAFYRAIGRATMFQTLGKLKAGAIKKRLRSGSWRTKQPSIILRSAKEVRLKKTLMIWLICKNLIPIHNIYNRKRSSLNWVKSLKAPFTSSSKKNVHSAQKVWERKSSSACLHRTSLITLSSALIVASSSCPSS